MCAGAVGTQAPILAHDLRSIRLASPAAKNFCTTIFGLCPLPNTIPHAVNLTAAPLEANHPHVLEAHKLGRSPPHVKKRWVSKGRTPFQIVHISDVHVDRSYAVRAPSRTSSSRPPTDSPREDSPAPRPTAPRSSAAATMALDRSATTSSTLRDLCVHPSLLPLEHPELTLRSDLQFGHKKVRPRAVDASSFPS